MSQQEELKKSKKPIVLKILTAGEGGVGKTTMLKKYYLIVFITCLSTISFSAVAQGVNPTETEISAMPPYCQAVYKKDPEARKMWAKRLGESGRGFHHHCHGLLYMFRALYEIDEKTRNRHLARAIDEFQYVLRHWSPNAPLYPEAETNKALAETMRAR